MPDPQNDRVYIAGAVSPEARHALNAVARIEGVAGRDLVGEILQGWIVANAASIVYKIDSSGLSTAGPFAEVRANLASFFPDEAGQTDPRT